MPRPNGVSNQCFQAIRRFATNSTCALSCSSCPLRAFPNRSKESNHKVTKPELHVVCPLVPPFPSLLSKRPSACQLRTKFGHRRVKGRAAGKWGGETTRTDTEDRSAKPTQSDRGDAPFDGPGSFQSRPRNIEDAERDRVSLAAFSEMRTPGFSPTVGAVCRRRGRIRFEFVSGPIALNRRRSLDRDRCRLEPAGGRATVAHYAVQE